MLDSHFSSRGTSGLQSTSVSDVPQNRAMGGQLFGIQGSPSTSWKMHLRWLKLACRRRQSGNRPLGAERGGPDHVVEEQLARVGHRRAPEELWDLPRDPVGVGKVEQELEDDKGDVAEDPAGEVLLGEREDGEELADAKDDLPELARGEEPEDVERERLEDVARVDGRRERDEARHLLADFGPRAAREGEEHGPATLRVADVGDLGSRGLVDVVDLGDAVVQPDRREPAPCWSVPLGFREKGERDARPGPVARVPAAVLAVGLLEVGPDVAEPDVVALLEQPEGHAALLVEDKVGRVAEDAVLEEHGVAADAVLGREEVVQSEDEAVFGLDVVLFALRREGDERQALERKTGGGPRIPRIRRSIRAASCSARR